MHNLHHHGRHSSCFSSFPVSVFTVAARPAPVAFRHRRIVCLHRRLSTAESQEQRCSPYSSNAAAAATRVQVFSSTSREGVQRCIRLIREAGYRRKAFENIWSDIKLNVVAGGVIFAMGDVLAQIGEQGQRQQAQQAQQAQHGEKEKFDVSIKHVNFSRSLVMGIEGVFLNGVFLTPFYRWLDVLFGATHHKNSRMFPGVFQKVMGVQILYMPFSTCLFISTTPILHYCFNTGIVISSSSSRDEKQQQQKKQQSDQSNQQEQQLHQEIDCQQLMVQEKQTLASSANAGIFQLKKSFLRAYLTSWAFWPFADAINFKLFPARYRPIWDSFIDVFWTAFLSFITHNGSSSSHNTHQQPAAAVTIENHSMDNQS